MQMIGECDLLNKFHLQNEDLILLCLRSLIAVCVLSDFKSTIL